MDIGYACLSTMVKDASPAKTVTVKRLEQLEPEAGRALLRRVAETNLTNTLRLLWHNIAHGLRLYRLTSQLIPLATHPLVEGWAWEEELAQPLARVRQVVEAYGLRISLHTGAYTVLSSHRPPVVAQSIKEVRHQARLLSLLGGTRTVLHIGSGQGGKGAALARFAEQLPPDLYPWVMLENDDTLFTGEEVLGLAQRLGVPMVFDWHHERVNPSSRPVAELLAEVFATWPAGEKPKVHLSSPQGPAAPKAHHDYVEPADFEALAAAAPADFDLMVEAKAKDAAALRLCEEIGLKLQKLANKTGR